MTTRLDIRLPEAEMELLNQYCQVTGRNKTEVIREFIRSLKRKLPKNTEMSGT